MVFGRAQNRAFIFIKPHAITDKVKDFVREHLRAKGVNIVKEGTVDAEVIDKSQLIDKHYYAIASKATLLTPDALQVPHELFKDKFGTEWDMVLKNGSALNARDASKRFGLDARAMADLWNQARQAGNFVKFRDGFYCAKLEHPGGLGSFYVFNAFFLEMRSRYVAPGAAIHYFLTEWNPTDLGWSDFLANVIGSTDPAAATPTSIRGNALAEWQELGLKWEPNITDNVVHASSSPLEALFERINWLGTTVEDDAFGARLLERHVTPELVEQWHRDPQVSYGQGDRRTTTSLYAAMYGLDTDRCITQCAEIASVGRTYSSVHKNRAFAFIKPHAVTASVRKLVRETFEERGLRIMHEGFIEAQQINEEMLIDRHYYAIASKATLLTPDKLPVPADKFQAKFGIDWASALKSGKALNAKDACTELGLTSSDLATSWKSARAAGNLIKFGGGFYCAKIATDSKGDFYVFNGFFMDQREQYVKPGAEIYYFVVEWDPVSLSWADFRAQLVGPTDPAAAPPKSVRGRVFQDWQQLGLKSEPNMGNNGLHASASPVEAMFECVNWLGCRLERDPFGKLLLQGGVTPDQIEQWSKDPHVVYGHGPVKGSFYDCLEDKDTDACLEQCLVIARTGHTPALVRNSAFLFIKPHAVTEKTKEFVTRHLQSKELHIVQEGTIDASTIDKNMLIDKHYYAIGSKATMLNPDQLPVPEDKFHKVFGMEWSAALQSGCAMNAKQACETFNLDALGLGEHWMKAKKAGKLCKFGGGFYCAQMELPMPSGECRSVFVFNGFFLEMRAKYVNPGTCIHYYVVEWDPLDLSWADFRGKVLGPTDPATAPDDSVRGLIYHKWEELGLKSQPNVGDNGVHASASPFEALAEKMNWLGLKMEQDAFGQLLLHSGVNEEHIAAWALDPQVTYDSHQDSVTGSLYDALEDLDADRCVTQCQIIAGSVDEEEEDHVLSPAQAQDLHKRGHTIKIQTIDGFDTYAFKYFLQDGDDKEHLWEVIRSQVKKDNGMYGEPVWSGRQLSVAEAHEVLKLVTPNN
jgi:nucleoside diphosphate kinase